MYVYYWRTCEKAVLARGRGGLYIRTHIKIGHTRTWGLWSAAVATALRTRESARASESERMRERDIRHTHKAYTKGIVCT